MDLTKAKKAHFIGVTGSGVSALVRLLAGRGVAISGSDLSPVDESSFPEGVYARGHDATNVPDDAGVVIYSAAVPEANPERRKAMELGIAQYSYPEALALATNGTPTIAVSGTHGKSTTTAFLGKLFEAGGFDPTVIVGAEVDGWAKNYRAGSRELFIVEACEYRRHMLHLNPQAIVLTNLELDHPDYYRDLADVKDAFREYINKLSGDGLLIYNADDSNLRDVVAGSDAILVRYGVGEGSDLYARNVRATPRATVFDLVWKGTSIGTYSTALPGLYNVYNIMAGVATYLAYGGKIDCIQNTLDHFHGVGRRFEVVGTLQSATVITDYAHHPTALESVVSAVAERYPGRRTLVVFRPHQRERTAKLYDEFVRVLGAIPALLLLEIFDVAGREEAIPVSSHDLVRDISGSTTHGNAVYAPTLDEAEHYVRAHAGDFDVVLVVGAGDADQLARRLVASSS